MLALAALLLLQPQTLTHNYGVMRVDRLIQSIASETGWPLAAPRSLPADFVYANIKGLDQQEVMESLAKCLRGRWTERGQVQSFTLRQSVEARLDSIRHAVDDFFRKEVKAVPELTAQTAKEQVLKLREQSRQAASQAFRAASQDSFPDVGAGIPASPFTTALRSLALLMGREFWCGIAEGDRVVATVRPTRMQRALPPGWQPVMERLQREARLFSTAAAQYGPTESEEFVPFLGEYTNLPATLGPFDLVCEGSPFGPTARLVFTDKSGDRSVPDTVVPLMDMSLAAWEAERPASEKQPFADLKGSIALSPDIRGLAGGFGSFNAEGQPSPPIPEKPLPEALRRALLEPEERDILDVILREPLDQLAARTGKGLVARIPDNAAMFLLIDDMKPGAALEFAEFGQMVAMCTSSGARLEQLGDTQILAPEGTAAFESRYSRMAVARLLKGLAGTAPILDVLADFCLEKNWGADVMDLYQVFIPRMEVRQIPFHLEDADQALLRIYGRLPAPFRLRLAQQPGTVLLGSLPPESQNDVYRLVYGGGASLMPPAKAGGGPDDPAASSEMADTRPYTTPFDDPFMMERSDWQDDPGLEPTRVLGDGLAPSLPLRLDLAVKPGWFELSDNGWPFAASPLSVYTLAYELSGVDKVEGQQPENPDAKAFVQGVSARLSLGFAVPGTCEVRRIMVADDLPVKGARFGLSSLPEPLRKAIAAMVERVKADKANERPPDQTLPAAVP